MTHHVNRALPKDSSAFAGYRFPPEVIMLAVRWHLRYALSYRDVEELLVECGIEVDHVTIHRWVQRFTPLLIEAARPCRRSIGSRWFVDETYVKVAGKWRYVYRAVDQSGQVVEMFVSPRRNITSARTFFTAALAAHGEPDEIITDLAQALETVIEELVPDGFHNTEQYANNRVECDHGRLKSRLRPMRGLKTDHTASVVIEVTPSFRTYDEATTNSAQTAPTTSSSSQHSKNSPTRFDPYVGPCTHRRAGRSNNATVPCGQDFVAEFESRNVTVSTFDRANFAVWYTSGGSVTPDELLDLVNFTFSTDRAGCL